MINYSKYIGYITSSEDTGTILFVGRDKAITASHVVEKDTLDYSVYYNGDKVIEKLDYNCININKKYAVITFHKEICSAFDANDLRFNTKFSSIDNYNISWMAYGFLIECGECTERIVQGDRCSFYGKDEYILSNLSIEMYSCEGMSGSPVIINNMIVGILQEEDTQNNVVGNLRFTLAKDFEKEINTQIVATRVYNNEEFNPIDYSKEYCIDNYIPRAVRFRHYDTEDKIQSLLTTEKLPKRLFVLLGEAGLGKTIELKKAAVSIYESEYNPLYKSLSDLMENQTLEDYFPELKEYVDNKVPFCLILDGYDEIKNIHYRDSGFPSYINQFIDKLKDIKYSVLISSRKSYYYSGKFRDFMEIELCELSLDDVNQQLDKNEINKDEFYNEVKNNRLESFIRNPFYLFYIIKLYKKNKTLPLSINLMDEIIKHLFIEKNYNKFIGQETNITPENRSARIALRKLATIFLMLDESTMSSDQLYDINDSIIKDNGERLKCSGILEIDNNQNWSFVHNNFCEYLAAEFLNEEYKDNLEGLLSVIAYKNGIYNNFNNLVTYLLLIRENNDLNDWILFNCPEAINNFEFSKIGSQRSTEIFISVFDNAVKKGYFIQSDLSVNIIKMINNADSVNYLLEVINKSIDDKELYNALRLLGDLENLYGLENTARNTLFEFIDSGRGNHNHFRDAIFALTDLGLSDEEITKYLFDNYRFKDDREIQRGLNKYIYKNDLADLFIDILIKQIVNDKDDNDYIRSDHYECLERIKTKESFISLFNAMLSMNNITVKMHYSSMLKGTIDKLMNPLADILKNDNSNVLLEQTLKLSALLEKNSYFQKNTFVSAFNNAGKDTEAIEYYYKTFKSAPYLFLEASKDLNCYFDFLISRYKAGFFSEDNINLFNYCVKAMGVGNPYRENCLTVISEMNYDNSQDSINYIKHDDNYETFVKENYRFAFKSIFDSSILFKELSKILFDSKLDDPLYDDFYNFVYDKYGYNSREGFICECLGGIIGFSEKISDRKQYYLDNKQEWIIVSSKQFISSCSNFQEFLNEEQIVAIITKATDCLNNISEDNVTQTQMRCAAVLVRIFVDYVSNELLIKLLPFSDDLYYDCNKELGFPDFIIKRLEQQIIQNEIEKYIDNDLISYGLDDICIKYCLATEYSSEKIITLARRILCNEFSNDTHYSAWKYLLENDKQELIVDMIVNGEIDKCNIISQIYMLGKYDNEDLFKYVSEFYCQINQLYTSNINADSKKEIIEKHPFLKNVPLPIQNNSDIKKALLYCLRRLSAFLIINDVDGYTDLYLDEMINNKTFSILDADEYRLMIGGIDKPKYLLKIVTIIKMVCEGCFEIKSRFSTINSDIRNSIRTIAENDFAYTVEVLSKYLGSENSDFKREVNLLYESIVKTKYENEIKKYSIKEIKQIVFS